MPIQENETVKQSNKDRLKDITDSIEKGIKELFESDKYKQYLTTMSRFHRYSVNNQMLIYMQMPNATHVAGFNKWHDQFERNVLKGQRGIKIIAPTPFKKKVEKEKLDPDTKLPVLDADGKPITEEKEISIPMFKPVTVFDVSQTEGKPLPQLASDLHGNVQNYEVFLEALKRSAPVPIAIEPMSETMDGYFDTEHKNIHIREGMSEIQTVSATVHEIAHSKLHDYKKNELLESKDDYQSIEVCGVEGLFSNGRIDRSKLPEGLYCYDVRGSDDDPGELKYLEPSVLVNHAGSIITAKPITLPEDGRIDISEEINFFGGDMTLRKFYEDAFPEKAKKSRNTEEVEAESISFAVCAYYGIATGENSFGYIASWSQGKELKELKASLETINKTSSELITDIDRNFAEVSKERGITQSAEQIENEPALSQERLYTVDDDKYLHVQRSDEGFDYTLYDMATKTEIDGGQLDADFELLSQAALEICKLHNIGDKAPIKLTDIAILDQMQNAEVKAWEDDHITNIETTEVEPHIPPVPQFAEPEEISNEPMPDPAVSIESMKAYGYTDETMLPLTKERAKELFDRDVTVYMLHEGNTEAMVFEPEDIATHSGLFGIAREDWEAIREKETPKEQTAQDREADEKFLSAKGDSFAIYQLKDTPENSSIAFMGMEYLDRNNIPVERGNYRQVYSGALPKYGTTEEKLDSLFETFNVNRPADFKGHSLSVSDIIALKQGENVSCHYCDNIGFARVTHFLQAENYLKNAEISTEDDYGMIDGIINNGKKAEETVQKPKQSEPPLAVLDLARAVQKEKQKAKSEPRQRTSVLAKLHAYQQEEQPKTTVRKSAERDL